MDECDLISLLGSFANQPHLLPALQTISVGKYGVETHVKYKAIIRDFFRVQSKACHMDVELYFETDAPFQIPLFFGEVNHYPVRWFAISDARARTLNILCEASLDSSSVNLNAIYLAY